MTNRDKINALSNIELAGYLGCDGPNCSLCIYSGKNCRDKSCTFGIKAWLGTPCEENPPADNVKHPAHYTFGKIEVIDFIEQQHLGFHLGNSVKYISRAGRKDPAKTIEDLKKAAWYLNRQIERLEREQSGQN